MSPEISTVVVESRTHIFHWPDFAKQEFAAEVFAFVNKLKVKSFAWRVMTRELEEKRVKFSKHSDILSDSFQAQVQAHKGIFHVLSVPCVGRVLSKFYSFLIQSTLWAWVGEDVRDRERSREIWVRLYVDVNQDWGQVQKQTWIWINLMRIDECFNVDPTCLCGCMSTREDECGGKALFRMWFWTKFVSIN